LQARSLQDVTLHADERRAGLGEAARAGEREHEIALARLALERAAALGAMDDTAKLALADAANAVVLADYLKTRVHADMDADQLTALAGVAGAGKVDLGEAARAAAQLVRDEQARREVEVDKDRRHQLDLLTLQNDVNKAALHAQASVAGARQCVRGHALQRDDRVCAACGGAPSA
jgi:hypothetical protein